MKSLWLLYHLFFVSVIITACQGPQYAANAQKHRSLKLACGKIPVHDAMPHIDWFEMDTDAWKTGQMQGLPTSFDVYYIDIHQLRRFFTAAKDTGGKTSVPLPLTAGCRLFSLERSGVLPDALAEKYPGLVSLKGTCAGQADADIRLDYDGNKMSGQVMWRSEIYLITPFEKNNDIYYLVYRKSDTGEVKEPFESMKN